MLWADFRACRSIGGSLADVLHMLSLDVVAVIGCYAICGAPSAQAVPQKLLTIGGYFRGCCAQMAAAPDGCIWIGDETCVQIFDSDCRFLRRVETTSGQTAICHGIAFNRAGSAFLTTPSHVLTSGVAVFSAEGKFMRSLRSGRSEPHTLASRGIAIDSNGFVYVADIVGGAIKVFDQDGAHDRSFVGPLVNGDHIAPHNIAVSPWNTLFVHDTSAHRMEVCSALSQSSLNLCVFESGI